MHLKDRFRFLPLFAALLFLVTAAPSSSAQQSVPETTVEPGQTFTGRVVEVKDEDTFELRRSIGGTVTVRLHGIDAPESSQPYSTAATKAARRYVGGRASGPPPVTLAGTAVLWPLQTWKAGTLRPCQSGTDWHNTIGSSRWTKPNTRGLSGKSAMPNRSFGPGRTRCRHRRGRAAEATARADRVRFPWGTGLQRVQHATAKTAGCDVQLFSDARIGP